MRRQRRKNIRASDLGIDLPSRAETEQFKWFLACLLFGKPIQQSVVQRTFQEFEREGLISPERILRAGWDKLVKVLDRGHYVRYDFSTATKLIEICRALKKEYGTVTRLLRTAKNKRDIERRLLAFRGIGPVTARIFLSEFP